MFASRIAVIGPSRAPVAEPFSGGLNAYVWSLCTKLVERGHDVTLFAAPGSDPALRVRELALDELRLSRHSRSDVSMPPDVMMREHHAYLSLMMSWRARRRSTCSTTTACTTCPSRWPASSTRR